MTDKGKPNLNQAKFNEALKRAQKGATPAAGGAARAKPATLAKVHKPALAEKEKALIIEPDRRLAVLLQNQVRTFNLDPIHYDAGNLALRALEKEKPRLIIIAHQLLDMGGRVLCNRIRAIAGLEEVPILMFTDNPQQATPEVAEMLGATDMLVVPLVVPVLMEKLRRVLRVEA